MVVMDLHNPISGSMLSRVKIELMSYYTTSVYDTCICKLRSRQLNSVAVTATSHCDHRFEFRVFRLVIEYEF